MFPWVREGGKRRAGAFSGPRCSNDSKPSHEYGRELKQFLSLTCEARQASRKCMENAIDSRLLLWSTGGRTCQRLRHRLTKFLLAQHSFPVENVWAVRRACCSKTKRDPEQFFSRVDVTSKYCTKNMSIPSDPGQSASYSDEY